MCPVPKPQEFSLWVRQKLSVRLLRSNLLPPVCVYLFLPSPTLPLLIFLFTLPPSPSMPVPPLSFFFTAFSLLAGRAPLLFCPPSSYTTIGLLSFSPTTIII